MFIDLILAMIFVIIITAIICFFVDGAYKESVLIGILILLIVTKTVSTIQFIDTSPILSLIISAVVISFVGVLFSVAIHEIDI